MAPKLDQSEAKFFHLLSQDNLLCVINKTRTSLRKFLLRETTCELMFVRSLWKDCEVTHRRSKRGVKYSVDACLFQEVGVTSLV